MIYESMHRYQGNDKSNSQERADYLYTPPLSIVDFKKQAQKSTTFLTTESIVKYLVQKECSKVHI